MVLLAAAVLFYFNLLRCAITQPGTETPTSLSHIAVVVSLVVWLGVGVASRAIGLL